MPAVINSIANDQNAISAADYAELSTLDYDGVVYRNEDDVTFIGLYPGHRLLQLDGDGGTILIDDGATHFFPIYRAASGLTVTFSN